MGTVKEQRGAASVGWGRLRAGGYVDLCFGRYVDMSSFVHTIQNSDLHNTQHAVCPSRQMLLHLFLGSTHLTLPDTCV